jgi:hypothetical protein
VQSIAIDPGVAHEMTQFEGFRIHALVDDYWNYTGRFSTESLDALRDFFPYRYFGLPPHGEGPERSNSLSPAVDAEQIERYFLILEELAPKYVELVNKFSSELPPMSEHCSLSLLIPASHESLRLNDTLKQILVRDNDKGLHLAQSDSHGCPIDPDRYEIIVLGNRDESDPEPDDTLDIVADFNRYFGCLGFRLFGASVSFPTLVSGCGAARKLLQDIALIRSLRRPAASHCLYLGLADADTLSFPRTTLDTYVRALDQHPSVPCVMAGGKSVHTPSALDRVPLASLASKIDVAISDITRSDAFGPSANQFFHATLNRRLLMGNITALRARSLVAAGGIPISKRASDLTLDEQLAMYRGRFLEDGSVFSMFTEPHLRAPLWIVTSPRRKLMAHILGSNLYQDGTFTSQRHTRLTRESDETLADLACEVPAEQGQAMVDRVLEKELSQLTRTAPSAGEVVPHLRKALKQCGLSDRDYAVTGSGRSCSVSLLPSAYTVAEQAVSN